MFTAFEALHDLAMDGFCKVVGGDVHLDATHVVLSVIGVLDIAAQIHRNDPWEFFPGPTDFLADCLIEALEQTTVYGDLKRPTVANDFESFVFGKKVPGDVFGSGRRQPIVAHGAGSGFFAVVPEQP